MKSLSKLRQLLLTIVVLHTMGMAAMPASASPTVSVSPSSAQVKPGAQLQLTATVTGDSSNLVVWSLAGKGCNGISCGMITSQGLYTAPPTAPSQPVVTVTATSLFNPGVSGHATLTIGQSGQISVAISPTLATIAVRGKSQFTAVVTGTTNLGVNWRVSGTGCVAGSCGSISSSGLYTAPATIPTPPLATITATSKADPAKKASARVVIESAASVSVRVSPAIAQVATRGQQQFSASVTGTTNHAVTWSVSGTGCSGSSCGTITPRGLYTAPATIPSKVFIRATAVADPAASGTASVTIVSAGALSISPSSPQVKIGGQVQFTATVHGGGSGVVNWSVSGSGCAGITCGSITSTGLYTAPAAPPNPSFVSVTATLLSNPSVSASTTVTILGGNSISVSISPTNAALNSGAHEQFTATVTGTTNKSVTWKVTGFGCGGPDCGTITSSGLYTAPAVIPNPAFVNVTATSVADSTRSATALVTLTQKSGVSVTPKSARVIVGGQQQFVATVVGLPNASVTWSVTGSTCRGAACGTISSSGLYSAPTNLPASPQVTVTATSNVDSSKSDSAIVTLFAPISVTITPRNAKVTVDQKQQFRAGVSGTANTFVTWSVSGTGCSGASCGTIDSTGLYTAPATIPSPATVSVKASSKADPSQSATATVTVLGSSDLKLSGQYAFLFQGFDRNGVYQSAGVFTADGHGKLTSGLEDINRKTGPATSVAFTGTYLVGGDDRGTLNISSTHGSQTFQFALNLLGTKGRFISFDHSGIRGSGVIERRDPAAIDPSALTGGYALALTGQNVSGQRIGALGLIFPDGNGFISGSSLDATTEGSAALPTFATFSGIYDVSPSGRGTATLNIPGFDGGVFNFAFYVVSANEFLLVSIDPLSAKNPIFGGPAKLQAGAPFLASSFTGGSAFSLSGISGSSPEDTVGRLVFDGSHNVAVDFVRNSGGNITLGGALVGAYDVQLNGRGTLNLTNETSGTTSSWYMYATAPGQAFLMDASSGAVAIGEMKRQIAVQPFSNGNILGSYLLGSGEPVVATTPLYSGVLNFDGGNDKKGQGSMSGAEDISLSGSLLSNQAVAGTYSVSAVSQNGRGAILLTSPSKGMIVVWVSSASEFVGLNLDPSTSEPVILHFEQ